MKNSERARRICLDSVEHLIALEDYCIVELHEKEEISKGGIVIPDKHQKDSFRGTVVAVGPGKRDAHGNYMPIGIEVGDVVIYRNFLGWKITELLGKQYCAVSGEERIAFIPKDKVVYE